MDGGKRRAVLVTIDPSGVITLRLKGTRRPLYVGAAALYTDLLARSAGFGATPATKTRRKVVKINRGIVKRI